MEEWKSFLGEKKEKKGNGGEELLFHFYSILFPFSLSLPPKGQGKGKKNHH